MTRKTAATKTRRAIGFAGGGLAALAIGLIFWLAADRGARIETSDSKMTAVVADKAIEQSETEATTESAAAADGGSSETSPEASRPETATPETPSTVAAEAPTVAEVSDAPSPAVAADAVDDAEPATGAAPLQATETAETRAEDAAPKAGAGDPSAEAETGAAQDQDEATTVASIEPDAATPSEIQTSESALTSAPEDADDAAPAKAPVFDLVRVEPDGTGLAAGRAEPNAEVEIVIDNEVVGQTTAGADGAFVAFFHTPPEQPTLAEASETGAAAPDPPAPAEIGTPGAHAAGAMAVTARVRADRKAIDIAAANTGPADGGASDGADGSEPARADAVSQPVYILSTAASDGETAAPVIVRPESDGLRLVQPPQAAVGALTLDAISYDPEGQVVFAGRAPGAGEVRLYLDGALVGRAPISDDRSWRARAKETIRPGVYTLRIDQADEAGAVASRIETPFQREAISEGKLGPGAVTIQRGDNLWRIAENYYGSGVRYTVIYGANRGKIRDPDLIYPGQVFTIPEASAAD